MADERAIVRYTEEVARELARTLAGDPGEELRTWLRLAHRREAMVTELYRISNVDERLRASDGAGPAAVMRAAMASIWAHEESHTRFLSIIRGLSGSPGLEELQGRIEGKITAGAVSGGLLARALIAVGGSLGKVPDFAADLRRMGLRQLVSFHGELEATARAGYERILALHRRVAGDATTVRDLGATFVYDIARILAEERFHEDAFGAMARWIDDDGEGFAPLAEADCARLLFDLAERNLSVGVVRRLLDPAAPVDKGLEPGAPWISDGGIGELLRAHGLGPPAVADPSRAAALLQAR
jgi:hypothetical protein